jgi:hypothetical protein
MLLWVKVLPSHRIFYWKVIKEPSDT